MYLLYVLQWPYVYVDILNVKHVCDEQNKEQIMILQYLEPSQ